MSPFCNSDTKPSSRFCDDYSHHYSVTTMVTTFPFEHYRDTVSLSVDGLSCAQRCKADDLPEPYKCPQCTGEFQKLLKQYLDNPQTSLQQRDFCDLCGLEEVDKEKPLICCTKCDRAFHADCGGETNGIFTGNRHWHWQVVATSSTDPCTKQPHQFFLSHSACVCARAPCMCLHVCSVRNVQEPQQRSSTGAG
jgi:hypothetical protein